MVEQADPSFEYREDNDIVDFSQLEEHKGSYKPMQPPKQSQGGNRKMKKEIVVNERPKSPIQEKKRVEEYPSLAGQKPQTAAPSDSHWNRVTDQRIKNDVQFDAKH